jgi:hypothetical protein
MLPHNVLVLHRLCSLLKHQSLMFAAAALQLHNGGSGVSRLITGFAVTTMSWPDVARSPTAWPHRITPAVPGVTHFGTAKQPSAGCFLCLIGSLISCCSMLASTGLLTLSRCRLGRPAL